MTDQIIKHTPRRLSRVFQQYDSPLYFITINTWQRQPILANQEVLNAFHAYAEKNAEAGRCIGRFVVMPEHIHFFCRLGREDRLSDFVRLMKQALGKTIKKSNAVSRVWQPGFFDHLVRHSESYAEKWEYVHLNPVRAGLTEDVDAWPWQGEVVRIDRA